MISWRFEASNDLTNWFTLDTRFGHLHSPEALKAISTPGNATTWTLSENLQLTKTNQQGFSAFRVVQIDQNSGQTHFMSLAGLEIYGQPTNPELWVF